MEIVFTTQAYYWPHNKIVIAYSLKSRMWCYSDNNNSNAAIEYTNRITDYVVKTQQ